MIKGISMYDKNNIFQKILNTDIPAEVIHEDDKTLAFKDVNPAAPFHVLLIPKSENISFADFTSEQDSEFISHFFKTAHKIATEHGLDKSGYRLITNHGKDAMQTVPHFHLHILGGKNLGPLVAGDEYHK